MMGEHGFPRMQQPAPGPLMQPIAGWYHRQERDPQTAADNSLRGSVVVDQRPPPVTHFLPRLAVPVTQPATPFPADVMANRKSDEVMLPPIETHVKSKWIRRSTPSAQGGGALAPPAGATSLPAIANGGTYASGGSYAGSYAQRFQRQSLPPVRRHPLLAGRQASPASSQAQQTSASTSAPQLVSVSVPRRIQPLVQPISRASTTSQSGSLDSYQENDSDTRDLYESAQEARKSVDMPPTTIAPLKLPHTLTLPSSVKPASKWGSSIDIANVIRRNVVHPAPVSAPALAISANGNKAQMPPLQALNENDNESQRQCQDTDSNHNRALSVLDSNAIDVQEEVKAAVSDTALTSKSELPSLSPGEQTLPATVTSATLPKILLENRLQTAHKRNFDNQRLLHQLQQALAHDDAQPHVTTPTSFDLCLAILDFFYKQRDTVGAGCRDIIVALEKTLRVMPESGMHARHETRLAALLEQRSFREAIAFVR